MKCVKMVRCRLDGMFKPFFFDAVLRGSLRLCRRGCVDARTCRACALCWRDVRRSIYPRPRQR